MCPDVPQQRAGSPVQTLREGTGPSIPGLPHGQWIPPHVPVPGRSACAGCAAGLRVWVETARLVCHEKPAGLLIILRDLEWPFPDLCILTTNFDKKITLFSSISLACWRGKQYTY